MSALLSIAVLTRSGASLLGECYFAKSCIASSARTPPMILIGAKGALAAISALETMMSSILVASCCTDAANTSRPMLHHMIAPKHIAHGSPEV